MIFLVNCGGCPLWMRTEEGKCDGHCSHFDEPRHCRRELCEEQWDAEVERLTGILETFYQEPFITEDVLDRGLNPRLAIEKLMGPAKLRWPEKEDEKAESRSAMKKKKKAARKSINGPSEEVEG